MLNHHSFLFLSLPKLETIPPNLKSLSHWWGQNLSHLMQPKHNQTMGEAIPLYMLDEFQIPPHFIDRHVTHIKISYLSNTTINFGKTLCPNEFIAMLRCEVLDSFLRSRAQSQGIKLIHYRYSSRSSNLIELTLHPPLHY